MRGAATCWPWGPHVAHQCWTLLSLGMGEDLLEDILMFLALGAGAMLVVCHDALRIAMGRGMAMLGRH